ncbi:hypothetical protein FHU36_001768 [Nonomuraea muscovyensis]|uniref:Uncharacterized protein n=1 Tax=Nonomuraea muscovyensis TaxID=1124761 RepID=A0A7X0EXD8_9ACTN|nr:hypothetical protein [Nonomuraea muscovyensis]
MRGQESSCSAPPATAVRTLSISPLNTADAVQPDEGERQQRGDYDEYCRTSL